MIGRRIIGSSGPNPLVIVGVVTPVAGGELPSNGNMETGDPPTGWSANGGSTIDGVADERTGGAGAQSLSIVRSDAAVAGYQGVAIAQGNWYSASAWVKNVSATTVGLNLNDESAINTASASWIQLLKTFRRTSAGGANFQLIVTGASTNEGRFDDVSFKLLTLLSLHALILDSYRDGTFQCNPTLTAGTQFGMACVDAVSPANGWYAYHDGTNAYHDKLVGGVWSSVISGAAAYGAGNVLQVVRAGTSFSLYYNGVQIGTTQTVSDLPQLNYFGKFSTYVTNDSTYCRHVWK